MNEPQQKRRVIEVLQEYSVFLIAGVILAVLIATGIGEESYHHAIETDLTGGAFTIFGHHVTPHWLINDVFMVFFFGIAAKEITEAMLPGGALNPPRKAINPLLGTLGGVLGPICVFLILSYVMIPAEHFAEVAHGWGIPTATDIALAWLVARVTFGKGHPAINFLLLLAIADDAIGLIIIAIFYPDPNHPVAPLWLGLVVLGMLIAFVLRKRGCKRWYMYIFVAGTVSWIGLIHAHLHPALALVPIVPFLPAGSKDEGLFEHDEGAEVDAHHKSPLNDFEHAFKLFVDVGLLFFGLTNAGVAISTGSFSDPVVFIVFLALLIGKPLGISLFSFTGSKLGAPYPTGLEFRHIVVAGIVGALGLTVALFVAGVAYELHPAHTGPAKMGALLSASAGILALIAGKILNVKQLAEVKEEGTGGEEAGS